MRKKRWVWVAVALLAGSALTRATWTRAFAAKQSRSAAEAELRAAEAERADAARRSAATDHPLGEEEAARARGYHRPGETPAGAGP